jgi:hypothetical protein
MGLGHGASIVRDNLLLHLDAFNPKSYPGSGTNWFDLSGNGNHFSLFQLPSLHPTDGLEFASSQSQYARSTNTLDLSSTNAITVELAWRVDATNVNTMIFEHTFNWNSIPGGFGAFANSNGGNWNTSTTNDIHTNSAVSGVGRADFGPIQDTSTMNISQFTYVSGAGTNMWNNGVQQTRFSSSPSTTAGFANANFYINTRAGTSFYNATLWVAYIKVYSVELSANELLNNLDAHRGRFGV